MRVAFFMVGREPKLFIEAESLIASVRRVMPGVHVTHLTDNDTPMVASADKVLRRPRGPLAVLRTAHQASLDGEFLFIDTDCIIQRDVRHVFEQPFDVALADRRWNVPAGAARLDDPTYMGMEYNVGIVWSRSRAFWQEVHERIQKLPPNAEHKGRAQTDWMGDQYTACDVLREKRYALRVLPGMTYHYPPSPLEDDAAELEAAYIVHYKGIQRKALLQARIRRETVLAQVEPPVQPITEVAVSPGFTPGLVPELAVRIADLQMQDAWRGVADRLDEVVKLREATSPRVFIGYDPRQPLAYNVAAHSVSSRASVPVAVTRLQLSQLPITQRGLTEFTFSRFLAPWLCGFKGWSVFLDADILCVSDVAELVAIAQSNDPAAVHVVQHQGERAFERASVMVFDNERCGVLTPEYVEQNAKRLLGLKWAERVGTLPNAWNYLVGYDHTENGLQPKLIHYTQGVPCWPTTARCEFSDEWHRERAAMNHTVSFDELMGRSVHVRHMAAAR